MYTFFCLSSPYVTQSSVFSYRSMVPSTEPPSELPMVSDINLRSPADGILAQRREKFRKKQQSSLSDSNSCDTPTSENSPRDLSMAKPSTPTLIPSSPTMAEAPAPGNFKHPHKPDPLRLPRDEANNDVPAHCTPSPFGTIPSPNWMVMKRYLDCGQMLKTPKQLDSSFFDGQVLPPPSSATPRSPKVFQNHSPRLPIPETPTDLSSANKFDDLRGNMEVEETEAAEDLSITSRKVKENRIKEELPSRYDTVLHNVINKDNLSWFSIFSRSRSLVNYVKSGKKVLSHHMLSSSHTKLKLQARHLHSSCPLGNESSAGNF